MTLPFSSPARLDRLLREHRYRRRFFDVDRRQTILVLAAMTVGGAVHIRTDLMLLHGSPLTFAICSRGALIFASVVAFLKLRRVQSPRQHDRCWSWWLAVWSILQIGVVATGLWTPEYFGPIIGQAAHVAVLYFALNGPIAPRMLAAAVTSIAVCALVWNSHGDVTYATKFTAIAMAFASNLVGYISARTFEQNRRKRFEVERQLAIKVRELAAEKEHALALSRTRAAFLATMSHEFRTPMNAVIGLSDLLLDVPLAPEHRNHVRVINESARALLTQLNDILDFAKIDADKLTLSSTPFDVRRLAASVVDMHRPAALANGLELSADIAPEVSAYLMGDDARLRQVIVNLVSNAIKFTERGAVMLRIVAGGNAGNVNENQEITFRVEDTGIGIEPEVLPRLFLPFEQADGGITGRRAGTGLGLTISKRIVRAMGGDISVDSEPGRGSVFSFTLRLPVAQAPIQTTSFAYDPREGRPQPVILVVDDLSLNRHVTQGQLQRLGYPVDLAASGPEALEAVSKKDYDVIFMDLRMPGMSGIEATRRIVDKLAGRRLPWIVALTASVFEEDREACRKAGMRDFLGKPLDLAQIDAWLCRIAAERGVARSSDARATLAQEPLEKLRHVDSHGEANFFAEVCRRFMSDLDRRLPKIGEAIRRGDLSYIENEAHCLRATSATVGAHLLANICGHIEDAARAGRIDEIHALVDGLWGQVGEVRRALTAEIGERS